MSVLSQQNWTNVYRPVTVCHLFLSEFYNYVSEIGLTGRDKMHNSSILSGHELVDKMFNC